MWTRALLLCSDVRFEIGDTMTLVGVFAERIIVEPGQGPLVIARLAIYCVVAGLRDINEVIWRYSLGEPGGAGGPIAEGRERHSADSDEHRLVHIMSPLAL